MDYPNQNRRREWGREKRKTDPENKMGGARLCNYRVILPSLYRRSEPNRSPGDTTRQSLGKGNKSTKKERNRKNITIP